MDIIINYFNDVLSLKYYSSNANHMSDIWLKKYNITKFNKCKID